MKAGNTKRYRAVTAVISIAAVALLALGSVSGARAALTQTSQEYITRFGTQTIEVSLVEQTGTNDAERIEDDGALLTNLVGENETFIVGKIYDEKLMAQNTGEIDQYVRMTIHKYWVDGDGKRVDLSPDLIHLEINEDKWFKAYEEDETIVLYYREPLSADPETREGQMTEAALESLQVESSILKLVTQTTADGVITTNYAYNGLYVGLDADVDAVQTHNAHDAILSAWGVDLSFDGTTITGEN